MRICLVGCGNHANSVYAPSLVRLKEEEPQIEYRACCDMDAGKAGAFRESVGFDTAYGDYVKMLETEKPDAVVLVTLPVHTAALAADILRRGFPVMMEKPIGDSLEECLSVVAASNESGAKNQAAFNRRHIPLVRELLREIKNDGKEIGHIDYKMYRHNRREKYFHSTAVHGIDLVGYIAGHDYGSARFDYNGLDIHMQCAFIKGPTAQLSFCPAAGLVVERLEVICDDASYFVKLPMWNGPDSPGSIAKFSGRELVYQKTGDEISDGPLMNESNGFYAQLKYFFDAIKSGSAITHDVASAADTMRLTDCVKRRDARYEKA